MPRGDGTGPWGQGAMTGRGLGRCNPDSVPYNRPSFGRRFGFSCWGYGPGAGRGYGMAYPYRDQFTDKEFLQEERNFLKRRLDLVDKELEDKE